MHLYPISLMTSFEMSDKKRVKLHGGSLDGTLMEISIYLNSYHHVTSVDDIQYKETTSVSSSGEVIFSCHDYMFELQ